MILLRTAFQTFCHFVRSIYCTAAFSFFLQRVCLTPSFYLLSLSLPRRRPLSATVIIAKSNNHRCVSNLIYIETFACHAFVTSFSSRLPTYFAEHHEDIHRPPYCSSFQYRNARLCPDGAQLSARRSRQPLQRGFG